MSENIITISELDAITTAPDTSYIPIDDGTNTNKITVADFNSSSASSAASSAAAAADSATLAESYAKGGTSSRTGENTDNAKYYMEQTQAEVTVAAQQAAAATTAASTCSDSADAASTSATLAGQKASAATASAASVATSATNASASATEANTFKNVAQSAAADALSYKDTAFTAATNAASSESTATSAASSASTNALKAEGYAVGSQNGTPAESGETYYHDNAKYYKEQAASSAADADGSASIADTKASAASLSAFSAKDSKENSEAWSWGKIDGVDVPATHPAYHNNAKYWADAASGAAGGGVTSFNGRSGIVVPAASDYTASDIDFDNTSNSFTADDVQEAIEEVQTNVNTVSGAKADKVSSATSGNFAGLDSNGNLTDSGSKASDFLTSHQSLDACYQTGDTAETSIDDADYVPFYDSSATGKRKSLWSNIKSVLKTYFDTLYKGISVHDAWSEVTSKPFSSVGSGLTVSNDTLSADIRTVGLNTRGAASLTTYSYQGLGVNTVYDAIEGTVWFGTVLPVTLSTSQETSVTFTHEMITSNSVIDVYAGRTGGDVSGAKNQFYASSVYTTNGSCTVTFPKEDSAINIDVRLYVK